MMRATITDKEISFVVQGPVQAKEGRKQIQGVTAKCLASIRHFFPNSIIILSTWKGQETSGLYFDQLLELDDPGSNRIFVNDQPVVLNNNRQLVSSHQGLKQVTTRYAVKMRSDNTLTGRAFVDLYCEFYQAPRDANFSFLKQRIITTSTFFIQSHYGAPINFHKSDLFDFGLTEDLLTLWPEKLVDELHFSPIKGYKSRHPATEQFLCLHWLSTLLKKPLHINSKINDNAGLGSDFWRSFLAANILAEAPEKMHVDVTERFYHRGNLSVEYDIEDWKVYNGLQVSCWDQKRIIRFYKNSTGRVLRAVLGLFSNKK